MDLRVDPDESGVCLACGSHLPPLFGRIHGDDDDRAHRCPECDSWVRICEESAARPAGYPITLPTPKTKTR
ncbi:hypothetical protein ABNG03_09995 [Halorubrum sp. RMP-47]|uniref:Small CPxCG-related zinc finger protein n=1 Tax=Halorubrum miltondacostae TaxID=3076378 RepID=A0ABD5LY92_9EURY